MAVAPALAQSVLTAPASQLLLAEWRDPGGGHDPPRYIAPLHVHHDDDEAWYVLDGTLTVRAGDEDVTISSGGAALVPRGTPHTYWNPRPQPVRYLLVMTPRINALIEAIHAMTDRSEQALRATFAEHRSEYLGWP